MAAVYMPRDVDIVWQKKLVEPFPIDPRYKMKYVTFCLYKLYSEDEVKTIMNSIKSTLGKLVHFYTTNDSIGQSSEDKQGGASSEQKFPFVDDDDDDALNMFESDFAKECIEDNAFEMKNELERYLAETNEDIRNKTFDILAWWKVSSSKYHILSQIARDVFAIQVSTVASESVFSTGGRVLDCFRSSLSPFMVEALICCQNWLRATPLPLDMGSVLEEHATYESVESDKCTTDIVSLN